MSIKYTTVYIFIIALSIFSLSSCDKKPVTANEILPSDDVRIGETIDKEFYKLSDSSSSFNILEKATYWEIYGYSDTIISTLLNKNSFTYSSEFNWKLRIFDSPEIKNAFAAPGGYIYVSKDLILSLADEAQYVAILAHAMLLSDLRITTEKLKDRFSVSYLLDISIGGNVVAPLDVFEELKDIPYSYENSVNLDSKTAYLICASGYDVRKFSLFLAEASSLQDQGLIHEWLSLYPASSDRSEIVYSRFNEENCSGTINNQSEFEEIKISIDL